MKTEWIRCDACGADDFRELGQVGEWHIGECGACSLVRVNPVPYFEPSREFSELSLDFQYTRFQHAVTPEVLRHDAAQFERQWDEACRLTGRERRPGRFLDLGCGYGGTVHAAAAAGWEAMGIDLDPSLVEEGRRRLGADLRCGTLPDASLPGDRFDFIRLRDVIEHLPNPLAVLLELKRLLAPGGVVLVITPNEGGLPTRVRDVAGVRRTTVATVAPPHHLHGFAPATLRRILLRAGLRPAGIFTTTPVDPLFVTARNILSSGNPLHVLVWRAAVRVGMGSMLVGWAVRDAPPSA